MRKLSVDFLKALKDRSGVLNPILERVKMDDTLMLAIREGYINIYYRGGNLLRISPGKHGKIDYEAHFDKKYDDSNQHRVFQNLRLPAVIMSQAESRSWVSCVPMLKEIMDFWFCKHPKHEREFQQIVARENNRSPISQSTEYFITDIEYAVEKPRARFDMLAVHWPAGENGNECRAALIEMKYGDSAIAGKAGLIKHLKDINAFLSDKQKHKELLQTIEAQFEQLAGLGLIRHKECATGSKIQLNKYPKPQFIFLLANHNPRSSRLKTLLKDPEVRNHAASKLFDLRFFVSSDAGYGMYTDRMLNYRRYLKRLE